MAKRVLTLIDGSNFYFKLKDLGLHDLLEFDFSGFAKLLARKYRIVRTVYYIGKIRTDNTSKTSKLHNNQQKLFAHLRKQRGHGCQLFGFETAFERGNNPFC